MDAQNSGVCQQSEATIWSLWDCRTLPAGVLAGTGGTWRGGGCRLPAEGRDGDTGAAVPLLHRDVSSSSSPSPSSPRKHPQGRDEAQPGLFNLRYPPTQTRRRGRR